MNSDRWKSPLTVCAMVLITPLLGCARNLPAVQTIAERPLSSQPILSASDLQAITMQALNQPIVVQPTQDRPAPHRSASNDGAANPPLSREQAVDQETPDAEIHDRQFFDRRILAAHNRERMALGLEPLNWNPTLAQSARRWADHLASTGRFEHAPENRYAPQGENLWAGSKGYFAPEAMVNAWIREKKYFRPGTFPDNSVTGRVEDVGHYTQVVWRATREVGCAEARSRNEDILVCRYAEAGNYRGEQPF